MLITSRSRRSRCGIDRETASARCRAEWECLRRTRGKVGLVLTVYA
eukprot:COSAG02_NODE_31557_length_531_cov_1.196759_1_plen_45_part_10